MKMDADEKELLSPSSVGSGSPPREASASGLGLALRQGDVPKRIYG